MISYGFRARRSCETQLVTLAQELLAGLDKKHQHVLIILDFSKGFDRVPHQRLMMKLDHYGIRGSIILNWIEAFLTDRTQQVLVEGTTSDSIPVMSSAGYHKEQTTCQNASNQEHVYLLMVVSFIGRSRPSKTVPSCKRT